MEDHPAVSSKNPYAENFISGCQFDISSKLKKGLNRFDWLKLQVTATVKNYTPLTGEKEEDVQQGEDLRLEEDLKSEGDPETEEDSQPAGKTIGEEISRVDDNVSTPEEEAGKSSMISIVIVAVVIAVGAVIPVSFLLL